MPETVFIFVRGFIFYATWIGITINTYCVSVQLKELYRPFTLQSISKGFYSCLPSIEYWPDPQRGIREAYRVLKLGGKACVKFNWTCYLTFWTSCSLTDVLMLIKRKESIFSGLIRLDLGMLSYKGLFQNGVAALRGS